jgi:HK97 family phage prohead protease
MTDTLVDEERKTLTADDLDKLDDSDFAYIDAKGEKHLPIHDEAHVRAALSRFNQTEFDSADDKATAAKKILAAAKKFDIEVDPDTAVGEAAGLKSESKSARKPRHGRELALQTKCRRQYAGTIEVRTGVKDANTGADLVELTGQVIGYETPYEVNDMFGSFTEVIHRGACEQLLEQPNLDVAFLVGHNASVVPLARTGAKASLELSEDKKGLQVRALIDPRMTGAQDLLIGLENGTISQMSVGMQVDPDHDVWSGNDAYGMPNKRDIYRLANVFDASAVAFPANPNTALELASARMEEFPPEVSARAQHVELMLKEGRKGAISQADSDAMLHVFRHLFGATSERNAPTAQDSKVSASLATVGQAIHDAMAAQAKDPDNNTDPKDKKILSGLKDLQAAHANLMHLQAQDGAPDDDTASVDAEGGADGTTGAGPGNAPGIGNQDGTGSRSAAERAARLIEIDQDLMRLARPPVCV